jgi:hypothetical protein
MQKELFATFNDLLPSYEETGALQALHGSHPTAFDFSWRYVSS